MKKRLFLSLTGLLSLVLVSGCSIDYTDYYKKYGDVANKDDRITSAQIDESALSYSSDGSSYSSKITDYGAVFSSKITHESNVISVDGVQFRVEGNEIFDGANNKFGEVDAFTHTLTFNGLNYTYVDTKDGKDNYSYTLDDQYEVHSSYYSKSHDTVYIAYDKKDSHTQTITSRDLALMEEHILYYFNSTTSKSDYNDYIKVIRIYPDYASSTCRHAYQSEGQYSQTEGCASYNGLDAVININSLNDMNRFFNPKVTTRTEGGMIYTTTVEPKRDTLAHEFGHVSTYYNLIAKGDTSYEEYLRIRLSSAYDTVFPSGLPTSYSSDSDSYYKDPTEILADDYVELYYNTSVKNRTDYNDYTLAYTDLRNSLNTSRCSSCSGATHKLKSNETLLSQVKSYYDSIINNEPRELANKRVVKVTGNVYATKNDAKNSIVLKALTNKEVVALATVTIDGNEYYRVVLKNFVSQSNVRNEYSSNIGYVLVSDTVTTSKTALHLTKLNGETMGVLSYIPNYNGRSNVNLYAYYDFSYFIESESKVYVYNVLDDGFTTVVGTASTFK